MQRMQKSEAGRGQEVTSPGAGWRTNKGDLAAEGASSGALIAKQQAGGRWDGGIPGVTGLERS